MSRHRTIIRLSAVLAVVALAKGCGDGDSPTAPPTPEPARPTTVTVSPATHELTVFGMTVQLTAEVRDQNARVMVGATVTWTSSANSVATVDASGLVTAVGNGTATITASVGSVQGTAEITVGPDLVGPDLDRAALVALYNTTDGLNWVDAENWLTDAPLGNWYGVDTDTSGRVVRLDLAGRWDSDAREDIPHGLSGPVPTELGSLTNLELLNLGTNDMTGPIPTELGNLANLESLSLGNNGLTGPIPTELGNLANLTWLSLGYDGLTGPIPSELGNLANLEFLYLGYNSLTGPIPPELGNLANLTRLNLYANSLTGPIPPELGSLASLESLHLSWNALTGPIPESFLEIEALEQFRFERNADLCTPGAIDFVTWLEGIETVSGPYCNESDVGVLNLLYETSGGPDWTNSTGWLETPALDEWYGVTADALGRVEALDLTGNGLAGRLPANLGELAHMTELRIAGNTGLSGSFPSSLTRLSLVELHYADTALCAPFNASFQTWLNGIPSHEGTAAECAPWSDYEVLEVLFEATGGPNWTNNDNWLTDSPLRNWHGVQVDSEGRVRSLSLSDNALAGSIPPELGNLANLTQLTLSSNQLTGPIPPELGNLANLRGLLLRSNQLTRPIPPELGNLAELLWLWLDGNNLTGPIPPQLGNLPDLKELYLYENQLSGPIPPELGDLAQLERLYLYKNQLSGPIPPELGNLASLDTLSLSYNNLSGPIPPELGNFPQLSRLWLDGNNLMGPIPPELSNLSTLDKLFLDNNALTGPVPPEFGGMASLRELGLANNPGMAGALPSRLTDLRQLEALLAQGTELCAPSDPGFQAWLRGVHKRRIMPCVQGGSPMAYLVQAVQSRAFPVPLVAEEKALLRVFPTARSATSQGIPAVRARFYIDGRETHMEDIPGKPTPIPAEVDEGSLSRSANVEIPGDIMQPGLEMVIEIDPNETLEPGLGVAKRIPETGRLAVDVREMPVFDLTVIPFLWSVDPDRSILGLTAGMAADPEGHELLSDTRTLLPVGDLDVKAHEPVLSMSNNAFVILRETKAIRALEGGSGHYMGMMAGRTAAAGGVANQPGRSSFSKPFTGTIAHELGHNMNLAHAPCGGPAGTDPSFPYPDGNIGVWGYDFRSGSLVAPATPDLMSYCGPKKRISDYHFTNALRYRLVDEDPPATVAVAAPTTSLLLWGGVGAEGEPFLEPAFVVDAPPALPDSTGAYRLASQTADGRELFSFTFAMPVVADGDGSSSFVFALPVQPGWTGNLATVTLSGPDGSTTLDSDTDLPMTILLDSSTGQVRGILRDLPQADAAAMAPQADFDRLDVLFSRGIPDVAAWRR